MPRPVSVVTEYSFSGNLITWPGTHSRSSSASVTPKAPSAVSISPAARRIDPSPATSASRTIAALATPQVTDSVLSWDGIRYVIRTHTPNRHFAGAGGGRDTPEPDRRVDCHGDAAGRWGRLWSGRADRQAADPREPEPLQLRRALNRGSRDDRG